MMPPNPISEAGATGGMGKHFFEKAEEDPCVGCSAPCCRSFFLPYPTPATFMDLDAILFMLGFPYTEMILNNNGNWKVMMEGDCQFFDAETNLCTIYGTARRPKTCRYFNPYQCWHKHNFHNNDETTDIIRIDAGALEAILDHVRFDDHGNITEIPAWEILKDLAKNHRLEA